MASDVQYSTNPLAYGNDVTTDASDLSQQQTQDNNLANQIHDHSYAMDAQTPLRIYVECVVREYFKALGDEMPTDLYELILKEVELPLLTVVLEQTRGNQSKCAQILGLNRGTLRKKLKTYHLM